MNIAWRQTVAPAHELVSITEAKLHLRVDQAAHDTLITSCITAARTGLEDYLGRGLVTQTWQLTMDGWASAFWLPRAAPLKGTPTIRYWNAAGAQVSLSTSVYTVDDQSEPARLALAPGQQWPALQDGRINAVDVTYQVGVDDVAAVDRLFFAAQLLWIEHLYRGDDRALTAAHALLAPHRVQWRPPCGGGA